jgi:hypothetical protein
MAKRKRVKLSDLMVRKIGALRRLNDGVRPDCVRDFEDAPIAIETLGVFDILGTWGGSVCLLYRFKWPSGQADLLVQDRGYMRNGEPDAGHSWLWNGYPTSCVYLEEMVKVVPHEVRSASGFEQTFLSDALADL